METQFDRLGVFAYSDEEGSDAHELDGKLPEEVKEERRRQLMGIQAGISKHKNGRMVGKVACAPVAWARGGGWVCD